MGEYLYESGRCAVAHAGQGPTVDPENPADLKRLAQDLPLIRALAAHAIESEFKIKSSATVYREHLYELAGFRALLGNALCLRLKSAEEVRPGEVPALPALDIGLHGEEPYAPLSNLRPSVSEIDGGSVLLDCCSPDGRTRMAVVLDFPEERLGIEIFEGLILLDDGTETAARAAISVMQFKKAYFANGKLVVRRSDTGALMGRCDAFLPRNVNMGATLRQFEALIDQLTKLADNRSAREGAPEER